MGIRNTGLTISLQYLCLCKNKTQNTRQERALIIDKLENWKNQDSTPARERERMGKKRHTTLKDTDPML
jgi:hypothetical protein